MADNPNTSSGDAQISASDQGENLFNNWIVEYAEARIVNRLREIQYDFRGHIYLVSFDILIKHLGSKWEVKKNAIWQYIQSNFEKEFSFPDWCMPVKDNSWLFVMPSITPNQASIKCEEIFINTIKFFVGDLYYSELPVFEVKVEVASKLTMRRSNCKKSAIEAENLEVTGKDEQERTSVVSSASNDKAASVSITEAIRVDSAIEPVFRVKELAHIGHRFKPYIVDPKSNFAINPQKMSELNQKIREDIHIANIEQGIGLLYDLPKDNRQIMMSVPATFQTMTSARARGKILSEITKAASELNLKILFELRELSNVPPHRLTEILTFLKPFCKAVIGHIGTDMRSIISIRGCGLDGVCLEYDRVERNTLELSNYLKNLNTAVKINTGIFMINGLENVNQIEIFSNVSGITHACMANEKLPVPAT